MWELLRDRGYLTHGPNPGAVRQGLRRSFPAVHHKSEPERSMAMRPNGMNRRKSMPIATLFAALALSGCATDDTMSFVLVSPGKFILYTCPELITQGRAMAKRDRELESLMAKAGQGAGGQFVNAIAYRQEYLTNRGEMKDLRAQAKEKQCTLPDLYAPGPSTAADTQPTKPGGRRPR